MVPAPFDDSGAQTEFDRAIAILEGELRVVFASPERVGEACDTLWRHRTLLTSPTHRAAVLRLVPLAIARTTPPARRVFELLRQVALASADPWPIGRYDRNDQLTSIRHLQGPSPAAEQAIACADVQRPCAGRLDP